MRMGLTALPTEPANNSDAPGIKPKPTLPPTRADSLRNFLLLVDIHFVSWKRNPILLLTRRELPPSLPDEVYGRSIGLDTRKIRILFQCTKGKSEVIAGEGVKGDPWPPSTLR